MEITQNALPFGLHEKTSEGLSAKKSYASPTIKVVEFVVEKGLTSSPNPPESVAGGLNFEFSNKNKAEQTSTSSSWAYNENWWTN